jgi:CheY-like chemotaxis protein
MEYRAIELVARLGPAGIVCDIDLPHADIVELTRRIKASRAGTRAVLVLIADGIPADGHAADGFLRQPVDPLDVVSLIGAPGRSRTA